MSSQADAKAIAGYESIVVNNYCIIAASAFVLYEYFVTFDREVASYWNSKASGSWVIFLSTRYITVLGRILVLVEFAQFTDESCTKMAQFLAVLSFMQYLPWAAFSALRAYALCRNIALSTLIFLLSVMPIPVNGARFAQNLRGINDPIFGCFADDDTSRGLQLKFVIIARVSLITADALLIAITWWAIPKSSMSCKTLRRRGVSLAAVLLRDGLMYFGILLIMNVLHLAFSLRSMFEVNDGASNITAFTEAVTPVLIARFLLDLQEANRRAVGAGSTSELDACGSASPGRTLSFARVVVGSMGSTIGPLGTSKRDSKMQPISILNIDGQPTLEEHVLKEMSARDLGALESPLSTGTDASFSAARV